MGRFDGTIDILWPTARYLRPDLLAVGIFGFDRLAAGRCDPLSVDIVLIGFHYDIRRLNRVYGSVA